MLKIENLAKSFGPRQILKDVNLELDDGQILTIVGPSGAGKTTLLRIIAGLETADQGQMQLDSERYDLSGEERGAIGVVFQDYKLFPNMSVLDNITLAPQLALKEDKATAEAEARDLLGKLEMADKSQLYPYQLSGGQKQRVAIARALAMKPKILCYDEPTSALDPAMRDQVAELILGFKETGLTQLIITHDMDFAKKVADQVFEVKPLEG
ncbi:amino acid ABC transporter ATP-binding protein [Lactobacillus porci]|uniref:Amino acid ABC transporter ATP-binding protein n=1 Tax=Lactobacillus porci TaxID=2012477 RepID=A0A6A8ME93_9LACO|nr:amino acid ABC transporter ATP-binding protein [Lactobacillus porci]MST87104.1 amino acid ABC transporter ATP-binding protein [Lactobacillus porci]